MDDTKRERLTTNVCIDIGLGLDVDLDLDLDVRSPRALDPHSRHTALVLQDALSYLREVKTRFQNNRKVYDNFLEIMKQFKAQCPACKAVEAALNGHYKTIEFGWATRLRMTWATARWPATGSFAAS